VEGAGGEEKEILRLDGAFSSPSALHFQFNSAHREVRWTRSAPLTRRWASPVKS
jgi:hypothetical protein